MQTDVQERLDINWSGKRDSNPQPLPWQGNALPIELFPRKISKKMKRNLQVIGLLVNVKNDIFYPT